LFALDDLRKLGRDLFLIGLLVVGAHFPRTKGG